MKTHEYSRVDNDESGMSPKWAFQLLVWQDDLIIDAYECVDLYTLKEIREEKHSDSKRVFSKRVNAIVDVHVGDNVYQDVIVISEVKDVRDACGTPDDERPEWKGAGFLGYCEIEGGELIHAWDDLAYPHPFRAR